MLATLLLVLGICTRLIVHIPNFTPLIAIALFSGVYLNKRYSLIVPLALLAISDVIIGFHETMVFTWGSTLLITAIGLYLKEKKNFKNIFFTSIISSIIFFVITNFGVWMVSGLYAKTWAGFAECFILAIPFFRNELLATWLYSAILFGAYEWALANLKNTRLAHVL